ncbi:MAG: DUF4149 domain-containing protein [Neisseriaceae bacterium]|nr:DUF4149 domain-containing protein [Neisseriaceae bacterium]
MTRLIETLCIVAWLGIMISVGYVVAPVLFSHLDKETAGNIAGELFHIVSYTSLIAAVILFIISCMRYGVKKFSGSVSAYCLYVGIFTILINEFLITPVIVALKTGQTHKLALLLGDNFMLWHGISQIIYLITVLIALIFTFFLSETPCKTGRCECSSKL